MTAGKTIYLIFLILSYICLLFTLLGVFVSSGGSETENLLGFVLFWIIAFVNLFLFLVSLIIKIFLKAYSYWFPLIGLGVVIVSMFVVLIRIFI